MVYVIGAKKITGWPRVYALTATVLTLVVICPAFWLIKMTEFLTKETWKFWKRVFHLYVEKSLRRIAKIEEGDLHPEELEKYT